MKLKLKRGLLRYVNAIKLSPFLATKIFDAMISLILSYNSKFWMFMESVSVNCSFAGVSCRCTLLRDGSTAIGWCGGSRVALCRTQ